MGDWVSIVQNNTAYVVGHEPLFDRRHIAAIDVPNRVLTISEPLSRVFEITEAKSILVTHGGRDEVDLMPIQVVLSGFGGAPIGDVVIQASGGSVRFWDHPWKEVPRVPNAQGQILIPARDAADGVLRNLWVELLSVEPVTRRHHDNGDIQRSV